MRTILRVGITVGGIAFVVLYPLQSIIGLVVVAGIVLAGFAAGLGTAKWLPRTWYGRQFTAGLRTSLIAVCMAGISVVLAAFNQGSHSEGQLVASSYVLGGSSLGPLVSRLAAAGWVVTTITVVTLAMLLGITLGVLATLLGAWGKNRHAIQVVNQARLAAQAGLYDDVSVPSSAAAGWTAQSSPGLRASSPGLRAEPAPDEFSWAAPSSLGQRQRSAPAELPRFQQAEPSQFQQTEPALPAASGRSPSNVRPADSQLTEAMREALATWATDNVASSQSDATAAGPAESSEKTRTPQPSAYLNSPPAAPSKRARKKQNTEWIR
jgi:hypothetical protein